MTPKSKTSHHGQAGQRRPLARDAGLSLQTYLRFARMLLLVIVSGAGVAGCHHDSTTSPMPSQQVVYAALGASDAVGIGAFPLDQGYVYQIRDGLQQRGQVVELHNFGVSGKRIDYIEETEVPPALAVQPNVVTIWAGPNDVIHGTDAAAFESALGRVFAQLRQRTTATVVMANLPDLRLLPRFIIAPDPNVTAARITAYNAAIMRQTAIYNIPLVDLYAGNYAANWDYISLDGFHPSNAGHAKLAELYLARIPLILP